MRKAVFVHLALLVVGAYASRARSSSTTKATEAVASPFGEARRRRSRAR